MRHRNTAVLVLALGGLALVSVRDDVRATGSIDVTDATVTIGDAPTAGVLTIDDEASLGTVPLLERPGAEAASFGNIDSGQFPSGVHPGLGGPEFRVRTDLTLPGGTYDYGSLTVDRGVVVRFTGPATIRALNFMQIDGRIEMEGPGSLSLDCAGDVTIVGHDEDDATGVVALDDAAHVVITVGGVLSVEADEGARVELAARGGEVVISCDADISTHLTSISHADIAASAQNRILIHAANGRIDLTDCTTSGPVPRVFAMQQVYDDAFHAQSSWVSLVVSGGELSGLRARGHWDIRIEDGAQIDGGNPNEGDASVEIHSHQGRVFVGDESSIVSSRALRIGGEAVDIADGCELRVTDESSGGDLVLDAGWNSPLGLRIGDGAVIENESASSVILSGVRGVEVLGTVRGNGEVVELSSHQGDVSIDGDADVRAPNGVLRLWAAGAVTAEDGQGALAAREFDVRCVTGDLDLDVETLEATAGRFVAMSNGTVRLRGSYSAAGDVQILSLLDSIDVSGATLATTAADAGPSGFVRLATYAATSIDASDATLSTGDSESRSGDVLIQVEADGTEVAEGTMSVHKAQVKRMPDGIHARLSGTMSIAGLGSAQLAGSARVQVGGASHRVFLNGSKSKFSGERPGVSLRVSRTGKTRAKFILDLKESVTKDPGTIEEVRFVRAGLRANGKFRRPKTKN